MTMTTADQSDSHDSAVIAAETVGDAPVATAAHPPLGNPGTVGIPTVIAGALGLGLVNVGYISPGSVGAIIPIIMTASVVGLLIATIWAAGLGQNAAASLYAVFFGFYGSYAALILGLTHDWYGIVASDVTTTVAAWIISWLVTIGMVTLVTLRLPWSYTLLLGLVDVALVLLLIGTLNGSTFFARLASVVVFVFIAVAIYLYADIMSKETGGKGLPLGRPLVSS